MTLIYLKVEFLPLENINLKNGGSNITQAIMESLQYFKMESGLNILEGNILLFTDSEENTKNLKLKIPDSINLGIVGVGTLAGGGIPIRSAQGFFRGYKQYNGKRITSRLNENFFKRNFLLC